MKFKSTCIQLAALFAIGLSSAGATPVVQTVNAPGMPLEICDLCTVSATMTVSNHSIVDDLNVLLNITHSFDADLILSLSHAGTTVLLSSRQGGSGGAGYIDTLFDDGAAVAIDAGFAYAPYTGSFRPMEALSAFKGHQMFGDWTLTVSDNEGGDAGVLNGWRLTAEVPEPGSLALFGLGAAALFAGRRRKQLA